MKHRRLEEICEKLHAFQTWRVPLDRQFVKEAEEASRGLVLTQTGTTIENTLFATKSGGVQMIASLAIGNDSRRDINVNAIFLNLPFHAPDFKLMEMPPGVASLALPALGPAPFERSDLLNARLGRRFSIPAHLSVDGLLLAEGLAMVPKDYRHGATAGVEVTVFASRGRRYSTWMKLRVERQDQTPRGSLRKTTVRRQPLFEPGDFDVLHEHDVHLRR